MEGSRTRSSLRPGLTAWRMTRVVAQLAWSYALLAAPFAGVALIVIGVVIEKPLLRYSGAFVLGASGAVLLNDFVCGLACARFPLGVLRGLRTCPRGRLLLIVPLSLLLTSAVMVSLWAAVRIALHLA